MKSTKDKNTKQDRPYFQRSLGILGSFLVFTLILSAQWNELQLRSESLDGTRAGLFSWLSDLFGGGSSGSNSGGGNSSNTIFSDSIIHSSSSQMNFEPPPNPNGMVTEGSTSRLLVSQSETIDRYTLCRVVSHSTYPTGTLAITQADVNSYTSQIEVREPNGYLQGIGMPGTTGLSVFVPYGSEREWRCFLASPPEGVTVSECAPPPPPPPVGTRFRCFGSGAGCWGRTAACPAGQILRRVRAINHPEQSDTSIENQLDNIEWGFALLHGAQMGDRDESRRRGERDPNYRTSEVNGVGARPAPLNCGAPGCLFQIPITGNGITFGCRDQDSNSSGRCGIVVDLDCHDPAAPTPTPPGTSPGTPSNPINTDGC